jgi:hypothetical protein
MSRLEFGYVSLVVNGKSLPGYMDSRSPRSSTETKVVLGLYIYSKSFNQKLGHIIWEGSRTSVPSVTAS